MTSILFTLIFGVLAGIAAFGGSTPLEMVLTLGLLGLAHMTILAGRQANGVALEPDNRGPK